MFPSKVIAWGCIVSAFGGILWLSPVLIGRGGEITLPLALLLTLGGLAALHARQGKQAGVLGWAGLVLGILGTGLILAFFINSGKSGNSFNANSSLGLQLVLGMGILGIGPILIGLRALLTKILPRSTAMLSFVIGVSQIGFGFTVWRMYYLFPDPWHPMTLLASASLFLAFSIGILWVALGVSLAQNPSWQDSNRPASA